MGANKDSVPKKVSNEGKNGPVLYTYAKDVPEQREKVFYVVGHSWVDGIGSVEQKNGNLEKTLKEQGRDVKIVFVGKIGSNAKWAQEQTKILQEKGLLAKEKCAGVAIFTGTNDLYAGRNLDSTATVIKETSDSASKNGIPVYVFNAPCHKSDEDIAARADTLNKKMNEKKVQNIIDVHSFTEKKKYYGKHPPTKGYFEISQELLLQKAILPSLKNEEPKKWRIPW